MKLRKLAFFLQNEKVKVIQELQPHLGSVVKIFMIGIFSTTSFEYRRLFRTILILNILYLHRVFKK